MARGDQNHSDACALSTLTDFWFTAAFGETMRCTEVWAGIQYVLFQVWNAANRICAKRLMPFLPTLLEALERHEHLHLTEECRSQLLAMSAATADRLLHSQRKRGQHSLSTTRAGTFLKQYILKRTRGQNLMRQCGFKARHVMARG